MEETSEQFLDRLYNKQQINIDQMRTRVYAIYQKEKNN